MDKVSLTDNDYMTLNVANVGLFRTVMGSANLYSSIGVHVYPIHQDAKIPVPATKSSACFDLKYQPVKKADRQYFISGYSQSNYKISRPINEDYSFFINPQERFLVPTGLIFALDGNMQMIPSLRIYARSGLSLKKGLVIANGEGVVDADYRDEVFVILTNISNAAVLISDNERIAQGEIVWRQRTFFKILDQKPTDNVSRDGGFGSTGVF